MSENLQTQKCIVAYIDLLGTSEAIKNDKHDINLNNMNYILQSAIDMCADKTVTEANVQIKAFSDNIVFATELPNEINPEEQISRMYNILEICSYFQMAAFQMGISIRGGITIGDFFCNNIFVWGKGLLQAYSLENEKAIFPRIVIDSNVIQIITHYDNNINKHIKTDDNDNVIFLDILSFIPLNNRDEYIKRTLDNAKEIIKCLKQNDRAKQKVNWFINYLESGLSTEAYN